MQAREGRGQPEGTGRRTALPVRVASLLLVLLPACSSDGAILLPTLRYGQVGEVRAEVSTPLGFPGGSLDQTLVWRSDGQWQMTETISYLDRPGGQSVLGPRGSAAPYAASYASFITQVNDVPGLRLFVPELSTGLLPQCGTASRVALSIQDSPRRETTSWVRCGVGAFATLRPEGSGPDPDASRVISAVAAMRDLTAGDGYRSPYLGSLPFGTLDEGEDSGVALDGPIVFLGISDRGSGSQPPSWEPFWRNHTRSQTAPPEVDWTRDMVIVGADGIRTEAGVSIRIERVLQVEGGAIVEMVERVPGDFCSPASRRQYPFHIVVVPRTPTAVRFAEIRKERVACGL